MAAVIRALLGYFFLVFIVRIVGRRPGKQLTPFEFVLVFFMGGLALTAIVGKEVSFTNAVLQIIAIGMGHYVLAWARAKSPKFARLTDGTPLVLSEKGMWRQETMRNMGIEPDDVIASARDNGLGSFAQIGTSVLERNGEISVIEKQDDPAA